MRKTLKVFCILLVCVFVFALVASCINQNKHNSSSITSSSEKEEVVDFSKLNMVAIGDSILSGAGIENPVTVKLKEILGLKNCLNYGIPGSSLSDVSGLNPYIYRYDKMLSNADIVMVQCSGNDIGKNAVGDFTDNTPTTFCGAINILAKGLKERYPNAYIFFQPGFMRAESYVEVATPYMAAMKELCKIHGFDYFDTFVPEFPYDYKTNTVDWVHLNQDYTDTVWAPKLAQFIKDNYKN